MLLWMLDARYWMLDVGAVVMPGGQGDTKENGNSLEAAKPELE
jgi:hypothetical protein